MSAIQSISHVLMLDVVIYVKPGPMHWSVADTNRFMFMVAKTLCTHINLLPCMCAPFPYPWAVKKHPEGQRQAHPSLQYQFVQLKSGRSCSLAHIKSSRYMVPWNPSRPVDPLNHICPPFLYLGEVEKQPGRQRPPLLQPQHPVFMLRFRGLSCLAQTSNQAHIQCHGPLGGLCTCSHASACLLYT